MKLLKGRYLRRFAKGISISSWIIPQHPNAYRQR
ncbi:unnamed protein product, partial [Larinioides sclopetarius]